MRAIALIEAPDHVCSRYRIAPFRPAIEAVGGSLAIEPLERRPWARLAQLASLSRYDVVVLQRKLLPGWQLAVLRKFARRLVFDFDDAVIHRDSNDPRGPHCPRRASRFRSLMRVVDGVIAGNSYLAQLAQDSGARSASIRVIPTCIEVGDDPVRFALPVSEGIRLVWIGSSGTLSGLERKRAIWEHVGRVIPGARLRVICDRFPSFPPLPIEAVPWDAGTERERLATSDVGISWIPDDLWSRGKCGLKVLQYMAAGLPVVANPVGVHPEMIIAGETGLLADSPGEWVEAVRELAEHPARRLEMGRSARIRVERCYSTAAWSQAFASFVLGSSSIPGPKSTAAKLSEVARSESGEASP
ncbi:MAG: glycosyltransferase family 4 protein [Isosphaeraceae bacterium]|nr:glycosyltransferase family 4 protein [Isosphaeraceae bacterium]